MRRLLKNATAAFLALTLASAGCGDSDTNSDPLAGIESGFTHKMMKRTGENAFASLAYDCNECTFEQFFAIEPPAGWTKGPTQVLLPIGEMRNRPSLEGVPDAMDFVPEVPGNEYKLIAKVLDARILQAGADGIVVESQVLRDTLLRYPAGSRVHELTDPEENVFVLFAHGIDPFDLESIDFQGADALAYFSAPEGWTYSTRILEEELALDSQGVVTVLAIRAENDSTWERR